MKRLFALGSIICLLALLAACSGQQAQVLSVWNRRCGLHLQTQDIVFFQDTHGGFLGDGDTVIVLRCADDFPADFSSTESGWRPLPLSEPLHTFFTQSYDTPIPVSRISDGYYFVWDRHAEATDPTDDTALFDRYSLNFSVAIYDRTAKLLYLFDCDT